jgi:hypothetical protein
MSDEKNKPNTAKVTPSDWNAPIQVARLYFVDALDFNAEQLSNVACDLELKPSGSSYQCRYLPGWDSFELTCARGGKVTEVRMIPRERVKQWTRAL